MAKPKEERNRQFQEDWQRGLGNEDLGKKYDLSLGGVKALKQRLRAKDSSLYQTKLKPRIKEKKIKIPTSQQVDKSISPLIHKRATYYLSPETIKKIKQIALNRDTDASGLVRKILSEWISG